MSVCRKAVKDNCLFFLRASYLLFLSHRSDPMDVTGTIIKVDVADCKSYSQALSLQSKFASLRMIWN